MYRHFSVVETSRGGAGLFDEEEEEDLFAEGKKEESEKEEPAPPAKQENKKKVRSGIRHISVYRIDSFSHIVINGFWYGWLLRKSLTYCAVLFIIMLLDLRMYIVQPSDKHFMLFWS